jgi:DNA-binding MarR family transcriptional regulator
MIPGRRSVDQLMKKGKTMDSQVSLVWLLFHVRHALFQVRANELAEYGVTPMKANVLFIVRSIGDEATPAAIARWLFLKPHSVSGLLTRMEKDGLVRRSKDLDRKNQVRIVLTEKANRLYRKSVSSRSFHRIMSCLPKEEAKQLELTLEKLRDRALKELGIKWKPPY